MNVLEAAITDELQESDLSLQYVALEGCVKCDSHPVLMYIGRTRQVQSLQ